MQTAARTHLAEDSRPQYPLVCRGYWPPQAPLIQSLELNTSIVWGLVPLHSALEQIPTAYPAVVLSQSALLLQFFFFATQNLPPLRGEGFGIGAGGAESWAVGQPDFALLYFYVLLIFLSSLSSSFSSLSSLLSPPTRMLSILNSCIAANLSALPVAGGFWAVILSRAAWKKSWTGRDPTRSIIPTDRSVAITGDTARAQLLTA